MGVLFRTGRIFVLRNSARLIVIRATLNPCNIPLGLDSTLPAMSNAFFSDLLASISERGRTLLRRGGTSNGKQDTSRLIELCEAVLSGRGRASRTAQAPPPGAPSELAALRADLLRLLNGHTDLAALDRDFVPLLPSGFNRGFFGLRRIAWSTPANILEQIIRYEAVHEIRDWDDLRRRIDPVDRRCYAFFHPALVDEPLIFVEVALTESIPGAIPPLLAEHLRPFPSNRPPPPAFHSL